MGPPRLVAREGGQEVHALELRPEQERWLVGRSAESDLCVEHASLSRKHCAISRAPDGSFYVADLGSTHGTHYEGTALPPNEPMRLFDGVLITLGQSPREYSTEGVPLVPVAPAARAAGAADGDAERAGGGRVVKGAARRPDGAAGADAEAEERAAAAEAEMAEMFGLPAAFGGPGKGQPQGRPAPPPKPARLPKKGQAAKLTLGANLGASLGIAPTPAPAPAPEQPAGAAAGGGGGEGRADGAARTLPAEAHQASRGAGEDGAADESDDELVGPPVPPGLIAAAAGGGAGVAGEEGEDEEDGDFVGPPAPPAGAAAGSDEDEDEDDEGEEDGEEAASLDRFRLRLPASHRVEMSGHAKSVTVLVLDPAGARLLSGSADHSLRLYDFNGMAADLRPFRSLEAPLGSCVLRSADWSPSGSTFALGGSCAQARLYDRDGKELCALMRGDMYLRDLRHTKGHVAALTCVRWHPAEQLLLATCGEDGTVRTWDVERAAARDDKISLSTESGQAAVLALRDAKGQRAAVSAIDWHHDGRSIALASADGCVSLWDTRHHATQPQLVATGAHLPGCGASCLRFAPAAAGSAGAHLLGSRGGPGDDCLKLWDLRMLREAAAATLGGGRSAACEPVLAWGGLPSRYSALPCAWSPSGSLLMTGTCVERGQEGEGGRLVAFCTQDAARQPLSVSAGAGHSVASLAWHPRLNQLFAGLGGGLVLGWYDPHMSERGLLFCAHRAVRRQQVQMGSLAEMEAANVVTPHALPLFKQGAQRSKKRGRERERERELERRQPMRPPPGVGSGGRVTDNLTHALIKTVDKNMNDFRDEDPREALLKFAELTEREPLWTGAYSKTQPKPVLAKTVDPADDEADMVPD